jgi:hypothetical protein
MASLAPIELPMRNCVGFAELFGLVLFSAWSALVWPQATAPPSGVSTLRVSTDLIQVPVLALRPPFRAASGLVAKNFVVRLDGGSQFHPSYVHVQGTEPLSLALLVDAETREPGRLSGGLQAALQSWPTDLLHSTDRLSIYVFGCRLIRTLNDSPADLTLHRGPIVNATSLSTLQAAKEGGSACHQPAIGDVLEAAISQMARTSGWRVLLMIVNGERTADAGSLRKVQTTAAAAGVTLFVIKYVNRASFPASIYSETEGFNLLSASLGGVNVPSSFEDLGDVTKALIENIRRRYILSFPRPANGDAGPHSMDVSTNVRGVTVRSSAASALLLDDASCTCGEDPCPDHRPQYGTKRPPK